MPLPDIRKAPAHAGAIFPLSTMIYSVSQQFYFRELRRGVPAGATVHLDDDVAQRYMDSHPGLLSPVRMTAQAAPEAVRSEAEAAEADLGEPKGKPKKTK